MHKKTIFVLENHPTDNKLIMSAAYDGMIVLWNIIEGYAVQNFLNE